MAAVEQITLDELHRRMGHIAPHAAKDLVNKGMVTGLILKAESEPVPTYYLVLLQRRNANLFLVAQGSACKGIQR